MDFWMIGVSAALGSAASWAGGAILFKRLGEHLSSPAMTWAKSIISVVLLAIVLFVIGFEPISWPTFWLLIGSGILGIALGDTFFFEALRHLGAHAVVVLLMLGQVFTIALAVLWLGERPTLPVWSGIALVLAGIWIVLRAKLAAESESEEEKKLKWRGVLFGLLSVLCMSVSIIIAKEALDAVSAMQATFIRMLAGMAGMLVLGMGIGQLKQWVEPFASPKLAVHFILAVCVITFGGFWLSLVAIKYVDVSVANTLIATEPLFVLPLAAIFLKEKITPSALLGSAVVVLGIGLIFLG
uniref:Uncharacterized membrane protein n=1 Tax=Candidatus Kentrum sp. FM TaxID=2126340 RepID=A0A450THL1_9GAMM|nr:MAG: Uncharacterized membrane protein [Candidatus Kentron sp. FM]VFJ66666.1 MAG: Uncharacterized membrane protein [Candidatus Kentron sp. FM]VFK11705.1 MAG: Uncharacterized membrane protein [Candidatus Kentron sp. FM]